MGKPPALFKRFSEINFRAAYPPRFAFAMKAMNEFIPAVTTRDGLGTIRKWVGVEEKYFDAQGLHRNGTMRQKRILTSPLLVPA